MDDLISRQAAIDILKSMAVPRYLDSGCEDIYERDRTLDKAIDAMRSLPPAQLEQDIEHCATCINAEDSVEICVLRNCKYAIAKLIDCYEPKQPERMTNRQWIDFLSAQFDISRTSAKGMLHGMMKWKKEDNFKKLFNGDRRGVTHDIS